MMLRDVLTRWRWTGQPITETANVREDLLVATTRHATGRGKGRLTSMHPNIPPPIRPRQLPRPRPIRQLPLVLVLMVLENPSMVPERLNREVNALLVFDGGETLVPRLEEGDVVVEGDGAVDGLAIGLGLRAGGQGAGEDGAGGGGGGEDAGEGGADEGADWGGGGPLVLGFLGGGMSGKGGGWMGLWEGVREKGVGRYDLRSRRRSRDENPESPARWALILLSISRRNSQFSRRSLSCSCSTPPRRSTHWPFRPFIMTLAVPDTRSSSSGYVVSEC